VFLRRRIVVSVGYVGGNVIQLMSSIQSVSSTTNCLVSGDVGGNVIQ
jgi:hypothetical protein